MVGQPGLCSKFQISLNYTVRSCLGERGIGGVNQTTSQHEKGPRLVPSTVVSTGMEKKKRFADCIIALSLLTVRPEQAF